LPCTPKALGSIPSPANKYTKTKIPDLLSVMIKVTNGPYLLRNKRYLKMGDLQYSNKTGLDKARLLVNLSGSLPS
jgi:hypothetical protein